MILLTSRQGPCRRFEPSCLLRILSAAALAVLAPAAAALTAVQIHSRVAPAVAVVETLDAEGRVGLSLSATALGAGRFVTVCDSLDGAAALRTEVAAARRPAIVTARDRGRNLCLLEVEGLVTPGLVQAAAPPPGSRVFAVSNALGMGIGISEGVVSGVRHYPDGAYIQFSAPISPGSQGGALVDADGALVGIIDYRRRDGQNVNFARVVAVVGEIEARAAAAADQLRRFDAASALVRDARWVELDELAGRWVREEPDSTDAWGFVAEAARQLKQHEKGLEAARTLWRIHPDRPQSGLILGAQLAALGRFKEAEEVVRELLARHREFAQGHNLLGLILQAEGRLDDAEVALRRALELEPWLMPAYRSLGELAAARGDHASRIAIQRRLASLLPDDGSLRLALVQAYLAASMPAAALAALERLPATEQESADAWYWRGIIEASLKRPEAAVHAFREALARQSRQPGWCWSGMGTAYYGMKRFPEAIEALEAAHRANPEQSGFAYQLGVALKDGGRPAEALVLFEELAARAPGDAANWRQVGFTRAVLDRHEEALAAMERSLQLDPRQPRLWRAMIESLQALDRRASAIEAYERLRAIDGTAAAEAWASVIAPFEEAAQ